jgi:tetratricopeptide (TPR) repeat protein
MDGPHTTAAIQGYLDELVRLKDRPPDDAVVRALLARATGRLHLLCTAMLLRSYPRLTRPPLNLRSEEMLTAWTSVSSLAALAAGADASREPVPLLLVVAGLLHEKGGDGLSLYRRVQAANPGDFFANLNLAECLDEMGDDDAIGFYRAALAVRPKAVAAHVNLGIAFVRRQRTEEAVACWRRALEIDPNVPLANLNLALAALGRNDFEEAAEFARKAAELEPRSAMNNAVLGRALLGAARFEEARGYIETALELYDPKDPQRPLAVMDLQTCLRQIEFGPRVAEYRARTARLATAPESLEIANLLLDRAEYALAARYFADAMEQDPSLAHDLSAGTRYNAACAAALAGTPRDHGGPIPPAEQTASRERARRWLREDLEAWTQALGSGGAEMPKYIVQYVGHWLNDRDIAPIREEAALAALPAAEQEEARALWRDVAALVERAKTAP